MTINLYFKPILDAVHRPFKENKQYWFSLWLILLLQQLTVYAADAVSLVYLIRSKSYTCVVFTILHTSAGPFKSKAVSVIDGLY